MADSTIQLPPDSTGKLLDTSSLTVGANTVQRERMNIADPTAATGLAGVVNAQPTSTDYALEVRPINLTQGSTTSGQTGPLIQGAVTTAGPSYVTAQTSPLSLDLSGNLRVNVGTGVCNVRSNTTPQSVADNQAQTSILQSNSGTNLPMSVAMATYGGAFSGSANAALSGWSKSRHPVIFKTVSATASGNTAIWTPGSGNKFRLLKFWIGISNNANLAAGAVLSVKFQDAAVDIGLSFDCFVPTTAVTTTVGAFNTGWIDLGFFGYQSSAANNALNVNLSATITTGSCRVTVCGVEE